MPAAAREQSDCVLAADLQKHGEWRVRVVRVKGV
jgi:hypothetical protein